MSEDMYTKEINDVIKMIVSNAYMQINGIDVAFPYMVGAPGGGKTTSLAQLCSTYKWGLISTHFALKPLEETGGIPQFDTVTINGKPELGTIWSFPDIMKQLFIASEKHEMVIWLLDDIHLCGAIHMAMLYELLTERKLRDYKLPKNVAIILAGNHGDNKAGAKTMFSAIVNRIALFPVYTSYENWKINFAIKNNVHSAIMSFLGNEKYQQFFHEGEQVDSPWGSPRSWTRFSNLITKLEEWNKKEIPDDELLYLAHAHVSKEAASEFLQYYKIFMKFDMIDILQNYQDFELPISSINQYTLSFALCSYYAGLKNPNSIVVEFSYIVYKYIKNSPDLGVMMIHEIIDIEKCLNKRNLYSNIAKELNKIEPGITAELLKDITNV